MNNGVILLIEDNPDDVRLTLRVHQNNHIAKPVVVARNGVKAVVRQLLNQPPRAEARP